MDTRYSEQGFWTTIVSNQSGTFMDVYRRNELVAKIAIGWMTTKGPLARPQIVVEYERREFESVEAHPDIGT